MANGYFNPDATAEYGALLVEVSEGTWEFKIAGYNGTWARSPGGGWHPNAENIRESHVWAAAFDKETMTLRRNATFHTHPTNRRLSKGDLGRMQYSSSAWVRSADGYLSRAFADNFNKVVSAPWRERYGNDNSWSW